MAHTTSPDESVERRLKRLDPLDPGALSLESVAAARDALGEALLREARRDVCSEAPQHGARSRDTGAGRGHGAERRPGSTRRHGARRRVVLSGAAVMMLAAFVLVATALLPAGARHDTQLGPAPASAAVALDDAASVALHQTGVYPTARQYEYVKVQEGFTTQAGMDGVSVNLWQTDTRQDWFRTNGWGRERVLDSREGFVTPADRAAARAHGMPVTQFLPNQDRDETLPMDGEQYWSNVDPERLPARPAALLRAIERRVDATETHPVPTASVFEVIADRLLFTSTSPKVRAALYRVIARLPGVQMLGWRTDRLGRRGLAVAIPRAEIGDETTRRILLFDPATSEPLETELVQTGPMPTDVTEPGVAPLPVGTVLDFTEFVGRGVVDSMTDLPGGGRVPFHRSVGGER